MILFDLEKELDALYLSHVMSKKTIFLMFLFKLCITMAHKNQFFLACASQLVIFREVNAWWIFQMEMQLFCWCFELERQSGERQRPSHYLIHMNALLQRMLALFCHTRESWDAFWMQFLSCTWCKPVKTGCWTTNGVLYLKNKPILTCLNFIEVYSNTRITNSF